MIYFDNSATTKPSKASLSKMREALECSFGNPSSVHAAGNEAKKLLEDARKEVLSALGVRRASDYQLFFTSGGTEANNLAILGSISAKERPEKNGTRGKIFISDGEHSSVKKTAESLIKNGFTVITVPTVGGVLDLDFIRNNADSTVILASFMLVNNETGALYDIKKAFDIIREKSRNAVCHTDAVQAFLKTKFTPASLGADLISVSSHKIFAPKGAGALLATREMITAKRIVPILHGGGQEAGYRNGTENTPAIAAFGAAAADGKNNFARRFEKCSALRILLSEKLSGLEIRINEAENRVPNIINITLPGIRSEIMLNYLSGEGICISAGSACSTHSSGPSGALIAFGLDKSEADTSVRISLSHENTDDEICRFADVLKAGLDRLQRK